jgi:CubicO group peptidase (beta-lactamase class C family)
MSALIALASFGTAVCLGFGTQATSGKIASEKFATDYFNRYKPTGFAYAIVQGGVVKDDNGFGVSDRTKKTRVTTHTVFPLASVSKPFVALGIIKLLDENKLRLSDPVGKYIPELPELWKSIPLIRLLDHTSGVPNQYDADLFPIYSQTPITSEQLLKDLASLCLTGTFGYYSYSNGNYVLLAKVIERVMGIPYPSAIQDLVFKPFGMTSTVQLTLGNMSKYAQGYELVNSAPSLFVWNPGWVFGNGDLASSIVDMEKFAEALMSNTLVKGSEIGYMRSAQFQIDDTAGQYGLGLGISWSMGASSYQHTGGLDGFATQITHYDDYDVTVVVLANDGSTDVASLAANLAEAYLGKTSYSPSGSDDNPALTASHLAFVKSIENQTVDTSKLSASLLQNYVDNNDWKTLGDLENGYGIDSFQVIQRTNPSKGETLTYYRLMQGPLTRRIDIQCNANGIIDSLYIKYP